MNTHCNARRPRLTVAAPLVAGLLALASWGLGSQAIAHEAALQPIASLDVNRYMGTWYEIAKYPNWFQRKCARNTQANYQVLGPAKVQVLNRCVTADGQTIEALGLARQIGAADSPKLEVRFAPEWLSFVPLVWGDYWVIDIDEAYQLVAVSEPKRQYLWVLSRTQEVRPAALEALFARLKTRGFDLNKLETTAQQP